MTTPSVHATLADLLTERAQQLEDVAGRFRAFAPSEQLPEHRILQLASDVLAGLGDLEGLLHRLAGWLPRGTA
jgi:hypothetical protein